MENIFVKEEQVVEEAEKLLEMNEIDTEKDALNYRSLLDEYKKLLNQLARLIKISDINQSKLKSMSRKLETYSNMDVLTGLYNRRYFNNEYEKEWLVSVRSRTPLAALMIDIDFFKKYNDTYGHLQGDTCLKLVAGAIQRSVCRPRDMVARFGGEEFVVILPDTGSAGACHVADIIMENVSLLDMEHRASAVSGNVTVSMGIAVMVPDKDEPSSKLLDMADIALYNAKHEGRNCYKASVQKEIF